METQCSQQSFEFQPLGARQVTAGFDGGTITSDAGGLLLREVESKTGLLADLAACFDDFRDPELVEHTVENLIKQRIFALALGYEDLNDHDQLRADPLLATLVGKRDVTGQERTDPHDRGKPLAGKSTLNRLELTPARANEKSRYKKIVARQKDIAAWFVEAFLRLNPEPPEEIILDLDATDDPIHGEQAGRFFHGYYKSYCYLPLYIFCGEHVLCARLRQSNSDASAGSLVEIERIVGQIRAAWPEVKIILRGDSGFCRNELMSWCEGHGVDYVFGLARNQRLRSIIGRPMWEATEQWNRTGKPARVFAEFSYQTRKAKNRGWNRERRVVAKAEHIAGKENPRFVVTSLSGEQWAAQALYEELYCARGDMENRIKEQFSLFADRVSAETMRANQLRLYFSVMAYVLISGLRRLGLKATEFAQAQVSTIRIKLLKIGAQVRISVRKVWISMASSYPWQSVYQQVWSNLRC